MSEIPFQIVEKTLDPMLVASIRIKGRSSECGKAFAKLGRTLGRLINGKPMLLHHDDEYRETDADFEACFPVRQRKVVEGIDFHDLTAMRCAALIHKGPYESLGAGYKQLLDYAQQHGYTIVLPTREVYLKGPGMIFRANPRNYLTEIQFPLESDPDKAEGK